MAAQLLHTGKDLIAGNVPWGHREIEAQALLQGRHGDSTGDRETIVSVPTVMEGCVPLWCPGAPHRGWQHKAGLINQDEGAAFTPGFFFSAATLEWATVQWPAHRVHGHDVVASEGSTCVGAKGATRLRDNR